MFLIEKSCQEQDIIEGIKSFLINSWYPFKMINVFEGQVHEESSGTISTLEGPVICYGSIALNKIAIKNNWLPGCFYSPNHSVLKYLEQYKQYYLNYNSLICKLYEVNYENLPEFFIRPLTDQKEFNGHVYTGPFFEEWFSRHTKCSEDLNYISPDTLILVSAFKDILTEYRFFVVNKKIVAQSSYRLNNKLYKTRDVPTEVGLFAHKMINEIWAPCESFVIDIAVLPTGEYKVVETNQLGCSGLYASDYEALFYFLHKAYTAQE